MSYPNDIKPCPYCLNIPYFKFYRDDSKWAFITNLNCSFCNPFEKLFPDSSAHDFGGLMSHLDDWNLQSSFHHERILYHANQFIRQESEL